MDGQMIGVWACVRAWVWAWAGVRGCVMRSLEETSGIHMYVLVQYSTCIFANAGGDLDDLRKSEGVELRD